MRTNEKLSTAETQELVRKAQLDDKRARERVILAFQPLVHRIVKDTVKYIPQSLSREDLCQEGNVGLLRALVGYQSNFGALFITYAAIWIRSCVLNALRDSSLLKIKGRRVRQIFWQLKKKSAVELAEGSGLPVAEVERMQAAIMAMTTIPSTDERTEDGFRHETIPVTEHPETSIIDQIMIGQLRSFISKGGLSKRDSKILNDRLAGKTLVECAGRRGISRERARQLEERATSLLVKRFGAA